MAAMTRHILQHPSPAAALPTFIASFTSPLASHMSPKPMPLHLAYLGANLSRSPHGMASVRKSCGRHAVVSKRCMATSAAAAKHETNDDLAQVTPLPPPRNAGASIVPEMNDIRPPEGIYNDSSNTSAPNTLSSVSKEVQTQVNHQLTKHSLEAPTAQKPASEAKARPKSKLRPLRNAVTLTPAAILHVKALLDQPEPKLLRIGTRRRGCSGLAYHLEYVDKADKFDEVVRQDGVEVLVEGRALLTVLGSTMDWVDEKLGSRFVFNNPNIKEQCGCGESFMV